jgi:hypothetical protein
MLSGCCTHVRANEVAHRSIIAISVECGGVEAGGGGRREELKEE